MNIALVSNEWTSNIWKNLDSKLKAHNVSSVRMAISYLMESGANIVASRLSKILSKNIPVEIVFGDDMGISESSALRRLLEIGCSLWVYRGGLHRGYHPKFWIIEYSDKSRTICLGSSNLSSSALGANVEANVVIDGSEIETEDYLSLWETIKTCGQIVDEEYVESYQNIENENKIKFRILPNGKTDRSSNYKQLEAFVKGWMHYIESPEVKGRTERWRGWYLLPSHGIVDINKLRELGAVIRAIEKIPQYQKLGYADIGSSKLGVANANAVIKDANIKYALKHSQSYKRALFVRQQKNYLERLGFVKEEIRGRIQLTDRGIELGAALNAAEMREALSRSMQDMTWPHGNIYFFPFLLDLINRVPDKRLYQDELDLFIIHTYNQAQIDNRVEIINMFRNLTSNDKEKFYDSAHQHLRTLLNQYRNVSAYGHYRSKISELMEAFGNTAELRALIKETPQKSYLTLRS